MGSAGGGSGGLMGSGLVMKVAHQAVTQAQAKQQQVAAPPATPDPGLPVYQKPNVDPLMNAMMQSAENAEIAALRDRAKMDTASLLARYGTRMAFAGIR